MNEQQYQSFRLQAGLAAIWVLMLILIIGTLAVSLGYLFGQNFNPAYPAVERFTTKQKEKSVATTTVKSDTLADYEYFMSEEFSSVAPDRQLLRRRRGSTEQGEIVNQSVRALAGLKADDRWTMTIFVQPESGTTLWMSKILPQTDAGLSEVWEFNTATETLTQLKNASAALDQCPNVTPGNLRVVAAGPQTSDPAKLQLLKLIDLPTDTVSTLVQLEGSETLSRFLELGHETDIAWRDAIHVSYAVYDSTRQEGEKFALKEKRTMTIPAQ